MPRSAALEAEQQELPEAPLELLDLALAQASAHQGVGPLAIDRRELTGGRCAVARAQGGLEPVEPSDERRGRIYRGGRRACCLARAGRGSRRAARLLRRAGGLPARTGVLARACRLLAPGCGLAARLGSPAALAAGLAAARRRLAATRLPTAGGALATGRRGAVAASGRSHLTCGGGADCWGGRVRRGASGRRPLAAGRHGLSTALGLARRLASAADAGRTRRGRRLRGG